MWCDKDVSWCYSDKRTVWYINVADQHTVHLKPAHYVSIRNVKTEIIVSREKLVFSECLLNSVIMTIVEADSIYFFRSSTIIVNNHLHYHHHHHHHLHFTEEGNNREVKIVANSHTESLDEWALKLKYLTNFNLQLSGNPPKRKSRHSSLMCELWSSRGWFRQSAWRNQVRILVEGVWVNEKWRPWREKNQLVSQLSLIKQH